jgi:hypothetical protein
VSKLLAIDLVPLLLEVVTFGEDKTVFCVEAGTVVGGVVVVGGTTVVEVVGGD